MRIFTILCQWTFAAALAMALALTPASVSAQSAAAKAAVDAAKAQGLVGEQGDGFLGFVQPPNPQISAAVNEINAGRAQVFRDIAMRTGVTPEVAGQATAQQLFGQILPGQFYRLPNGNWARK
jgi:uncharacterized protein YdbL (DUF1318 family)